MRASTVKLKDLTEKVVSQPRPIPLATWTVKQGALWRRIEPRFCFR